MGTDIISIATTKTNTDGTEMYEMQEAAGGTNSTKKVAGSNIVPAASETARGTLEIATQAETNTGTDDARAVTPLKLATYSGWGTKADIFISIRTPGASHTLDATDLASVNAGDALKIRMNVASANTVTIPLNATQAFPTGTTIMVQQIGAGQTSIVATGGVTINSANGWLSIAYRYSSVVLTKVGTNEWDVEGTLAP